MKTQRKPSRKIYGVTEATTSDGRLVCPSCLSAITRQESIRHHVVWYADGGHGFKWNILRICCNCHALLTSGDELSRVHYNALCARYMRSKYGLLFLLQIYDFRQVVMSTYRKFSIGEDILTFCRGIDKKMREWSWDELIYLHSLQNSGKQAIAEYWEVEMDEVKGDLK